MSEVNYMAREIRCKIVFYGPASAGKSTTLKNLLQGDFGDAARLVTMEDGTICLDLLPPAMGEIRGFKVRFLVYAKQGATSKPILKKADGVIFVADSQKSQAEANQKSLQELRESVVEMTGKSLDKLPFAVIYNKRDLPDIMTTEELHALLNVEDHPHFEGIATQRVGIFDAFKTVCKLVALELKKGGVV